MKKNDLKKNNIKLKEASPTPVDHILRILFRDITSFGGAFFFLFVSLLVLLLGQTLLFWGLVVGFSLTFIVTVFIRLVYFKDRPRIVEYHNFAERIDASSFPSLHTARSVFLGCMFANIFWFSYGWNAILFFGILVALVAYSRIYLQKHDWWDLLGGAVLGGAGYWLTLVIMKAIIDLSLVV